MLSNFYPSDSQISCSRLLHRLEKSDTICANGRLDAPLTIRIQALALRFLACLGLVFCCALDTTIWLAKTLTVYPMCKRGFDNHAKDFLRITFCLGYVFVLPFYLIRKPTEIQIHPSVDELPSSRNVAFFSGPPAILAEQIPPILSLPLVPSTKTQIRHSVNLLPFFSEPPVVSAESVPHALPPPLLKDDLLDSIKKSSFRDYTIQYSPADPSAPPILFDLQKLPSDLSFYVFSFFDAADAEQAHRVSKGFFSAVVQGIYRQLRGKERLEEKQIHTYRYLLSCASKEYIFFQREILNQEVIAKSKDCQIPFNDLFNRCHPKLKALSLAFLPITDETIKALAAACPQLIKLDLSLCRQITDRALELLGAGFSNLRYLGINGCTRITREGLKKLREARLDLKFNLMTRTYYPIADKAQIDEYFDNEHRDFLDIEERAQNSQDGMRLLKDNDDSIWKYSKARLDSLERQDRESELAVIELEKIKRTALKQSDEHEEQIKSLQAQHQRVEFEIKRSGDTIRQLQQDQDATKSKLKEQHQEIQICKSQLASFEKKFNQKLQVQDEKFNQRLKEQNEKINQRLQELNEKLMQRLQEQKNRYRVKKNRLG